MSYVSKYKELFNTINAHSINKKLLSSLNKMVNKKTISYNVKVSELPRTYHSHEAYKIGGETIISSSLDQGGCGACWAFASSSMFTSRIRINLMKTLPQDQLKNNPFFKKIDRNTGDIGLEDVNSQQGVVNKEKGSFYKVETLDRISPYYTAGFCPKLDANCTSTNINECIDKTCEIKCCNINVGDLKDHFSNCIGCEGNAIIMPLIMFKEQGSALLSDFGLKAWACTFGMKQFCTPEMIKENIEMYKAEGLLHVDSTSTLPEGVKNMEEWMMLEIYENGPIVASFDVREGFMVFGNDKNNMGQVFTADDNTGDILGGHAIMIMGWDVDDNKNSPTFGTKYWHIHNTWGPTWRGNGAFRMQKGINLANIESDWGCVYVNGQPKVEGFEYSNENQLEKSQCVFSKYKVFILIAVSIFAIFIIMYFLMNSKLY